MIYSLNGTVIEKLSDRAVIECAGVGYEIQMTRNGLSALASQGEKAFVYTHMIVREDSVELFGFCSDEERDSFRILINISGIGPKAAAAVLSEFTPGELAAAVAAGDTALITRAQGIGPKAAQRIILELKDKLKNIASVPVKQIAKQQGSAAKTVEAIDALMTLGYTQHEAKRAVSSMDISDMSVEDIIKVALKEMM